MLDLLDNLPRLRLSDDHMKAFIWVLKECGAKHVPTFSMLRKNQAELTKDIDIKTDRHTSSLGNEFFSNSPANLFKLVSLFLCKKKLSLSFLKQDFANPLVREFLEVYPDLSRKHGSEFWQAGKWIDESDLDDLSPMWANWEAASHRHFYIKELAQLKDGQFVIPMRYGKINGVEIVECYGVHYYDAVRM